MKRIIEKCLSRLSFADEIIVVDSGSQDGTVAICEIWDSSFLQ
jgi:glycosyltransferase involved in cell wall biosynthesis